MNGATDLQYRAASFAEAAGRLGMITTAIGIHRRQPDRIAAPEITRQLDRLPGAVDTLQRAADDLTEACRAVAE